MRPSANYLQFCLIAWLGATNACSDARQGNPMPDAAAASGGQGASAGSAATGGALGPSAGRGGAAVGGSGSGGLTAVAGSAGAPSGGSGGSAGSAGGGSTGTGGSAGSGGGNAGAGTSGTGAGPCSAPGLRFCDDFEKEATSLETAPWSIERNGMGTVTIDSTAPAHSGARSVRVDSQGYQTFFTLKGAPAFPLAAGKTYLRVYLRLSEAMTGGHNTYFKAGTAETISSEHETRIGVMVEMLMINQPAGDRGFLSNQNYWTDQKPGAVIAPQTWACVEVAFDSAASEIQVWLDGMDLPDLHRMDWQQDPIGAFRFGFESYAGPATTLWYDDVAVGSSPIGCF